ncbi:DUF6059 family protein [Streptomyces sp. NPDC097619]|uniref:DUF6059 family protein n=1 Tax=Streptomyces sp. NPDC097619 TaxID=3157228 RepID=UPI003316F69C
MRNRMWWTLIVGLGAVGRVWVPTPHVEPPPPEPPRRAEGGPDPGPLVLPRRPIGGPPPGHPEKWDALHELTDEEIEMWRRLV